MPHIILIIVFILFTSLEVFDHIFSPKHLLLVKTIQGTTFELYLHRLQIASAESWIFMQQQCLCYREYLVPDPLILGKSGILYMSKIFAKKLYAVTAGKEVSKLCP